MKNGAIKNQGTPIVAKTIEGSPAKKTEKKQEPGTVGLRPVQKEELPKGGLMKKLSSVAAGAVLLGSLIGFSQPASAHEVYRQVFVPATVVCNVWNQCWQVPAHYKTVRVPHHHHDTYRTYEYHRQTTIVIERDRQSAGEAFVNGMMEEAGRQVVDCIFNGNCD